jgi:acyl-CoA thioester hydrolase
MLPSLYATTVPPEWIDYNGHMNVAYYMVAFDRATDGLLDRLGLGIDYRRATNCTIYVLEAHVLYERELREGDTLAVTTQLLGADGKRLHVFHSMWNDATGERAATNELLCLHVDLLGSETGGPRAAGFASEEQARIDTLLTEHRPLGLPPEAGRRIALRRS